MKNYLRKISLGANKYAYEQLPEFKLRGMHIVSELKCGWYAPNYFYHYQSGGHIKAVKTHIGSSYFSKIDLSQFYSNITKNKIIRSLKKIGIPFERANDISAESVIYCKGNYILPFGFVQSSILSSIVMHNSALGQELKNLPSQIKISVYVDDIIISHAHDLSLVTALSAKVIEAAAKSNFPVNTSKCEIGKEKITVFNIELSKSLMEVSETRMAEFYKDVMNNKNTKKSEAAINYVACVNEKQSAFLSDVNNSLTQSD